MKTNTAPTGDIYKLGQIWYVRKRLGEFDYTYVPVRVIGIYPYIILTENRKGMKQAFTKACAFLDLYTEVEAKSRKTRGV